MWRIAFYKNLIKSWNNVEDSADDIVIFDHLLVILYFYPIDVIYIHDYREIIEKTIYRYRLSIIREPIGIDSLAWSIVSRSFVSNQNSFFFFFISTAERTYVPRRVERPPRPRHLYASKNAQCFILLSEHFR